MSASPAEMLLCSVDPAPVAIVNPSGASPFLLIGDHAGRSIPGALGDLGLSQADRARHIAWDIGVADLGSYLSDALDAVFIRQTYSRLVIDCNRDPVATDVMPEVSDGTPVPANCNLDAKARRARVEGIHAPYQAAIAEEIARRAGTGQSTILIALHSFTPRMKGFDRPWQIGILHNGANELFALALLERLRAHGGLTVGDNEPYRMDLIDYTVPRHAFAAELLYGEIEVRQDLIDSSEGVCHWGNLLAETLAQAAT